MGTGTETYLIDMIESAIIKKILECKSRKELDDIRKDVVEAIESLNCVDRSLHIQQVFRKHLNRLKRCTI